MRLLVVVALCLLTACCASVPNVYEQTQDAMVKLEWAGIQCSGVATGPNTVLTAAHCTDAGKGRPMTIDGKASTFVVVADDGNDHVLIRVSRRQAHTATLRPQPFRVGQVLFVWGHPQGLPSVMRRGRVAGFTTSHDYCFTAKPCASVFLDANVTHGDSGAPIFNEAGELVGIESGGAEIGAWSQPFFFRFRFTPAQLAQARA